MIRKLILLLALTPLATSLLAQTPYTFSRYDSIVVKFNLDTFDLAWAGGINYAQVSNIDLNFDGKNDIYVFDRTGNKSMCFLYVGTPGNPRFRYAPEYESAFPAMQNWTILMDYNCDGKPDIFTSTPGGIRVYMNTSSGGVLSFTLIQSLLRSWQLSNWVNIYVSSVDLPGLGDIDNDGDIDILTFGVFGTSLEYHRNYSAENGFGCDSLQFTMRNQCWGCFSEDMATNGVYLNDTCPNSGITSPELVMAISEATNRDKELEKNRSRSASRHSGSCTTILDVDGDGMKDVLLGDVSFGNEVMVRNGGTIPNTNQCMDSVDNNYPSYDVPISMKIFPCSFLVDTDNDGKKDLVVAPQGYSLSENKRSVLHYRNTGTNLIPDFNYVQRDFLQFEMIEKGEGAYPVLADYNGDGLMDLFVANFGAFNTLLDQNVSQLSLYINVGTSTNPVFNLVTENFASLDMQLGLDGLLPTFADLDNDGDQDMLVGNETGTISYFTNTAGVGNPFNFTITTAGLLDDAGTPIDVGTFSAPLLVDFDRDGDFDLIIGNKTGKLTYYNNIGTPSAPIFKYITDYLGNLNVKEWWDNSGYSVPAIIDSAGNYQLFIGSKSGFIHHYSDIDANIFGTYTLVDSTVFEMPDGIRSSCFLYDIDGDGFIDIFTGNYRGGLSFYKGDVDGTSTIPNTTNYLRDIYLYPNPASDNFTLQISEDWLNAKLAIYNMHGQQVMNKNLQSLSNNFSLAQLPSGMYFVQLVDLEKSVTLKLIHYGQ